jgi:hypothetical protein
MPKWGLTSAMRHERPYGLDPRLLRPAKTITDPVHGDIRLNLDSRSASTRPGSRATVARSAEWRVALDRWS